MREGSLRDQGLLVTDDGKALSAGEKIATNMSFRVRSGRSNGSGNWFMSVVPTGLSRRQPKKIVDRLVKVTVDNVLYVDRLSSVNCHVWYYSVTIKNNGTSSITIVGRDITIRSRQTTPSSKEPMQRVIHRPGVVGQFPTIKPGRSFSYDTAVPWPVHSGEITGSILFKYAHDDISTEAHEAELGPINLYVSDDIAVNHEKPLSPEAAAILVSALDVHQRDVLEGRKAFINTETLTQDRDLRSSIEHYLLRNWYNITRKREDAFIFPLHYWPKECSVTPKYFSIENGIVLGNFFAVKERLFNSRRKQPDFDKIICILDYKSAYNEQMKKTEKINRIVKKELLRSLIQNKEELLSMTAEEARSFGDVFPLFLIGMKGHKIISSSIQILITTALSLPSSTPNRLPKSLLEKSLYSVVETFRENLKENPEEILGASSTTAHLMQLLLIQKAEFINNKGDDDFISLAGRVSNTYARLNKSNKEIARLLRDDIVRKAESVVRSNGAKGAKAIVSAPS